MNNDQIKLLIVDDDYWVIDCLKKTIDFYSLDIAVVATAKNGKEGFSLYERYSPDILITDIKMPLMNGIDLIKKISAIPENNCQIIILSGYDEIEYLKEALAHGVNSYILKPFDNETLITALRASVSLIQQNKQAKLNLTKYSLIKERFIKNWLTGNIPSADLSWHLDIHNILVGEKYHIITLNTNPASILTYSISMDDDIYSAIIFTNENSQLDEILGTLSNINISIGVSNCHYDISEVPSAYQESLVAYNSCRNQGISFYLDLNISKDSYLIDDMMKYIATNFSSKITLSQYAHQKHVSEDYLWHIIKNSTGKTFKAILTEYRIKEAALLLKTKKYTISTIADMVGYQDTKHFRKVFKEVMNMSVTDYVMSVST